MNKIIIIKSPKYGNKELIVDFEDYNNIKNYHFYLMKLQNIFYAAFYYNKTNMLLHRFILNVDKKYTIDHINHNGLDNRKCNLRICTFEENLKNKKMYKNNTSGCKGVFFDKATKKWRTIIGNDKKIISVGYFDNKIDAVMAYNKAAIKYHGEFANLNII
jgi:hypothetical protein